MEILPARRTSYRADCRAFFIDNFCNSGILAKATESDLKELEDLNYHPIRFVSRLHDFISLHSLNFNLHHQHSVWSWSTCTRLQTPSPRRTSLWRMPSSKSISVRVYKFFDVFLEFIICYKSYLNLIIIIIIGLINFFMD